MEEADLPEKDSRSPMDVRLDPSSGLQPIGLTRIAHQSMLAEDWERGDLRTDLCQSPTRCYRPCGSTRNSMDLTLTRVFCFPGRPALSLERQLSTEASDSSGANTLL